MQQLLYISNSKQVWLHGRLQTGLNPLNIPGTEGKEAVICRKMSTVPYSFKWMQRKKDLNFVSWCNMQDKFAYFTIWCFQSGCHRQTNKNKSCQEVWYSTLMNKNIWTQISFTASQHYSLLALILYSTRLTVLKPTFSTPLRKRLLWANKPRHAQMSLHTSSFISIPTEKRYRNGHAQ